MKDELDLVLKPEKLDQLFAELDGYNQRQLNRAQAILNPSQFSEVQKMKQVTTQSLIDSYKMVKDWLKPK